MTLCIARTAYGWIRSLTRKSGRSQSIRSASLGACTAHEDEVIAGISGTFVDLSHYRGDERKQQTVAAMDRGAELIYSGRISSGDLLGEPDLLRKDGAAYIAGDIKSALGGGSNR